MAKNLLVYLCLLCWSSGTLGLSETDNRTEHFICPPDLTCELTRNASLTVKCVRPNPVSDSTENVTENHGANLLLANETLHKHSTLEIDAAEVESISISLTNCPLSDVLKSLCPSFGQFNLSTALFGGSGPERVIPDLAGTCRGYEEDVIGNGSVGRPSVISAPGAKLAERLESLSDKESSHWEALEGDQLLPATQKVNLSLKKLNSAPLRCNDEKPMDDGLALNLSHNDISNISEALGGCLERLLLVDLSHNALEALDRILTAANMSDLLYLNLSHNLIEVIPSGSLDGLGELLELDMSNNLIHSVAPGAFTCRLRNLQRLDLSGNNITSLGSGLFRDLISLRLLNLSYNALNLIDGSAFVADIAWHGCENGNDSDVTLPAEADSPSTDSIDAWPHFRTLDLRYNEISWVDKSLFRSAIINCRHFLVGHNNLSHFPRYGTERLPLVETMDLSHNKLYWLDVGTFTSRTLRHLDLSHNRLKKIISMTFLYLPSVRRVDLSHNHLSYVYKMAFYKTCKYDQEFEVDLSHNRLDTDVLWKLVASFRHLSNTGCAATLNLNHNSMRGILGESVSTYRERLKEGDLAYFRMWDNVLVEMDRNLLKCNCKLKADTDFLQSVLAEFRANFSYPDRLLFWQNLTCVRPQKVNELSVQEAMARLDCPVQTCPNHCSCSLKRDNTIINCTGKGLIYFPDNMPDGPKKVFLADNYITYVEDGNHLDNITYLDISANELTRIEPRAWKRLVTTAETLMLHNNYLYQMPQAVHDTGRLKLLTLHGNPFSCGCFDHWFIQWLSRHESIIKDVMAVSCSSGEPVLDLVNSNVCPEPYSAARAESRPRFHVRTLVVAVCVAGIVFILTAALWRYRRSVLSSALGRWKWYRVHVESEPRYDILVLYSQGDDEWTTGTLQKNLLYHMPDSSVHLINLTTLSEQHPDTDNDTVTEAMDSARSVVVVVSTQFMQTEWRRDGTRWTLLHHRDQRGASPLYFVCLETLTLQERSQMTESGLSTSECVSTGDCSWLNTLLQRIAPEMTSTQIAMDDITFTNEESISLRTKKY